MTDFASINLRQQRAQHYFQHYRRFTSHTRQRRFEHAARSDNDFVPLVHPDPAANDEKIGFPQLQHRHCFWPYANLLSDKTLLAAEFMSICILRRMCYLCQTTLPNSSRESLNFTGHPRASDTNFTQIHIIRPNLFSNEDARLNTNAFQLQGGGGDDSSRSDARMMGMQVVADNFVSPLCRLASS